MEIRSFSSTFNTDSLVANELLHSFHSSVPITKGTTLPVSFSNSEQDEGCTYNVTIRRVLVATVAVEKQKVLNFLSVCLCVCVSSRSYPASKVHVPCCIHVWLVRLYHIFPHYLIRGILSEKNILNARCMF